jgi:iron complex outermembrane receptor protein
MRSNQVSGRATLALLGSFLAAGAGAQDALDEVLVTAQKRVQKIQDVPLSVSAFSPEFIEQNNITDFGELALYTPGFSSSPNYSYSIYSSIRGVSTSDFGFGADPSIGFYVNGIHLGRYGTQVASYYDLDAVEVVKGPQNTLFGRSSIAGAISMTTKRPEKDFSASIDVGVGNRDHRELTAVLNAPAGEALAFRGAVYLDSQSGYLTNTNGGDDVGKSDIKSVRLSTRFSGIERLTADLIYGFENRKETGNVYSAVTLPDFTIASTLRGDENRSDFRVNDFTLDLAYDLTDRWLLKSVSNYRGVQADYAEDYDGLAQVVGGPYYQGQRVNLLNQEVRVQFSGQNGLSVILGASYFKEEMKAFVAEWVDSGLAFTGTANLAALAPNDYSNAFLERGEYDSGAEGWSAFLDATVPLGERFDITAGVRYNADRKDLVVNLPNPAILPENAMAPFPCACYLYGLWSSVPLYDNREWSDTSIRLAGTFKINSEISAYASYAQGWKAGGIESFKFRDLPAGFPLFFGLDVAGAARPNSYNPESSDSYEVGVKGTALDRRLRFSLAAFYYQYTDLQKSVFQGATASIRNIGEAEGQGIEGELRFAPNDHWSLFTAFAWNDTEIVSDPTGPMGAPSAQVGLPLNRSPEFSYSAGATYRTPAPWSAGGDLSFGVTYAHQDEFRTDDSLVFGVDSYGIVNLSASYESADGRYELRAYVDNVADDFTYNRRLFATPFVFPVESRSVLGSPREVGVNFRYRFGQ